MMMVMVMRRVLVEVLVRRRWVLRGDGRVVIERSMVKRMGRQVMRRARTRLEMCRFRFGRRRLVAVIIDTISRGGCGDWV